MVLSETQRVEVNRAVLDYLIDAGLSASAAAFATEAGVAAADLTDRTRGLLDKKWVSVVRLQVGIPWCHVRKEWLACSRQLLLWDCAGYVMDL